MTLIHLILVLALIGFLCWLIVTYIPMPEPFRSIILVVVVIVLILWLLDLFGLVGPVLPHLR